MVSSCFERVENHYTPFPHPWIWILRTDPSTPHSSRHLNLLPHLQPPQWALMSEAKEVKKKIVKGINANTPITQTQKRDLWSTRAANQARSQGCQWVVGNVIQGRLLNILHDLGGQQSPGSDCNAFDDHPTFPCTIPNHFYLSTKSVKMQGKVINSTWLRSRSFGSKLQRQMWPKPTS